MFAECFAPDVLEDVIHLDHGDKPDEQLRIFAEVIGNSQSEKRGRVADAIDADHESPLQLRSAFEKAFAVTSGGGADRQDEKAVNGNEDDEETVPIHSEENVLQRQDDEEYPEE